MFNQGHATTLFILLFIQPRIAVEKGTDLLMQISSPKARKYFGKGIFIVALLSSCIGLANASDFMVLNRDVTGDGSIDQIKLIDSNAEFYELTVESYGKEILKNENLVPKTLKNSGGLEIFQGLSVVDGNISIRYLFCSPSNSVCYLRNIISDFKGGQFVFSREETVSSADQIALVSTFFQKPTVPLKSLSYQSLLENNDNAMKLFANTYGSCVVEMDGDSLVKISDELEKDSPNEWVLEKGCVTPALVVALQVKKYLSTKAASKYFSLSDAASMDK
ncbi:hypothetical protein [Pseudomonas sp. B21-053]|uniref:hypothetical protein n=1 Tax=Pseudomonas sp. B21-053 TaxID=2895493 RepID=UPI002231B689|nr:hypothetical protein [Pseudomonas sp. B21-053]UZE11872.1 hypothetical protein LOY68_31215 [Pseudomonas sp. B21-053]